LLYLSVIWYLPLLLSINSGGTYFLFVGVGGSAHVSADSKHEAETKLGAVADKTDSNGRSRQQG
jgi:hypothetical protein